MQFRYYQLCHAAQSHFPVCPVLETDPVEDLLAQEQLSKPLSTLCMTLLCMESLKMGKLWEKWSADIPTLDRE